MVLVGNFLAVIAAQEVQLFVRPCAATLVHIFIISIFNIYNHGFEYKQIVNSKWSKNEGDGLKRKKKKYPRDSENDTDRDY